MFSRPVGGASLPHLHLYLQLFIQQRSFLQDLGLQLLLVFEEQSREFTGVLFAALLHHRLLSLPLLRRLLLVFIDLVQDEFHHLVTDNHPGKTRRRRRRKQTCLRWIVYRLKRSRAVVKCSPFSRRLYLAVKKDFYTILNTITIELNV